MYACIRPTAESNTKLRWKIVRNKPEVGSWTVAYDRAYCTLYFQNQFKPDLTAC